ncbi:exonuclease SbcCD subunit D [Clostridium sp. OS1-26]|uniref:exonuclease SbcCD subunit D n=1 Tax=Clostridium sp. OS1-26 TaxID=3070681 RepID=UPI0027E0D50A|nr:exonuclease SbcCD subunit D [Clostridium sp. OS1-26]WML34072.1 exonuclease SbcCD subunit D [Clostridium sp. OS1-26]
MKIIHTGDWHIGKIVHQVHMTEDQRYILNEFIKVIEEEKPHVIVIAGDLYDRSVPPVEAVELLDQMFSRILIDLKVPIMAIAGNHDSPDRVGFASRILMNKGLYIEGRLKKNIQKVSIHDEVGPVNFYLVPYADPVIVRDLFEDENIHTHDDAMKVIVNSIKENMNKKERNVLVAHGFVIGGETSDSERPLSIGGTDYIHLEHFKEFNYTALGHLHGPQKVGSDSIRYSGSLMKYSFSEVRHNKSITIVDIDDEGNVKINLRKLTPIRDMRIIRGNLEELLKPEVYKNTNVQDYIQVDLTDDGELIEPMSKIRTVYPNVLKLTRNSFNKNPEAVEQFSAEHRSKRDMFELFQEFYTGITRKEFDEDKAKVIAKVLKEVQKGERGE